MSLSHWRGPAAASESLVARGAQPLGQLAGPAPAGAAGGKPTPPGAPRPNAAEFGKSAQAVGTRYPGSYTPPGGAPAPGGGGGPPCPPKPLPCPGPPVSDAMAAIAGSPSPPARSAANTLPAVHLWSVWHQPNLAGFLLPP